MSVRALLVYPELPPTYWSMTYALPFIGKKASIPPLGLLTVASLLPADWDADARGHERGAAPAVGRGRRGPRPHVVHDRPAGVPREGRPPLQRARDARRRGRAVPDERTRADPGRRPLRPRRSGGHAPPLPRRLREGARGPRLPGRDPPRPRPHAPSAVRPREAPEVLDDGRPVLPGLPPLLRVLRHRRALRAPAPDEGRGPAPDRADAPLRRGVARLGLRRRRQLHRQREGGRGRSCRA